jgi:hypothetical protein
VEEKSDEELASFTQKTVNGQSVSLKNFFKGCPRTLNYLEK